MRAVFAILRKDLILELRSREVVVTLTVFSFMLMTLFSFSSDPGSTAPVEMAPGILWITSLFAGVLALNRVFERERDNRCFTALLLAPCDNTEIYWGKCLSLLLYMVVFQAVLWPVFTVIFGFSPVTGILTAWAGILLGDIGFVVVGVILSAVTMHAKGREIILPLLLLPLCLPVLIGGARVVAVAVLGGVPGEETMWLGRLAAFDVIYFVLGSLLFPLVVEE